MALSLLNFFFWEIPEAKIPFLIADGVVLIALHFIDRGVKAERKLMELQEHHADQQHEMDKEAKIAQRASQRTANLRGKNNGGSSSSGKTSHNGNAKHHHIQQPSKRD